MVGYGDNASTSPGNCDESAARGPQEREGIGTRVIIRRDGRSSIVGQFGRLFLWEAGKCAIIALFPADFERPQAEGSDGTKKMNCAWFRFGTRHSLPRSAG